MIIEGCVTGKEDREKVRILYLSNHLIIYDSSFTEVPIGSGVRILGEVQKFRSQRNPGCFDEKEYYGRRKYWAKVFADTIDRTDENSDAVKEGLYQIREFWCSKMKEKLGDESGGILAAMVLGNKGSADTDEKEWYQKAGLGHLMAVSGCHVSLIAAAIYSLLRRLRMSSGLAAVLTGSTLYFYVILCQSPVSAVRAYLMYMIFLGSKLCGRVYQGKRTLLIAAFIVLLWRPMDITDAGFLLSFGAMTGIWVVYPVLADVLVQKQSSGNSAATHKSGKIWWDSILLSLSVELVLLPLILYFYYEIPAYSLLFGFLAVGLFSVLMVCGSIGCVIYLLLTLIKLSTDSFFIYILEMLINAVWFPAGWILNIYHEICHLELKLPYARWIAGQPECWKVCAYYILLAVLLCIISLKKKKRFLAAFIGILLLLVPYHKGGVLFFAMLDVGQGDGFVMEGPGGVTYLFDGGSSDQSQPGKYILEPYLKYRGIGEIDYAFLSHGDRDHVNGVMEMLTRQEVGVKIHNLVLPCEKFWDDTLRTLAVLAEEQGSRVLIMDAGASLIEGDLVIQALYPGAAYDMEAGNDASLVLDIRYDNFSVLMTGDLGKEGEDILLEQNKMSNYTILKVGHHGSKNSSSEGFIDKIHPGYAFMSVGADNIYGHPNREVIELLKKSGTEILRTDQAGAVEISTDGRKLLEKSSWLTK